MQNSILAGRYAGALMSLANERGSLEAIHADMLAIQKIYSENADFRVFLKSPVIQPNVKAGAIRSIFSGKVNELTLLFIEKMVDFRRESVLGQIADSFVLKYKEYKGIVTIGVTTAVPLDATLKNTVEQIAKTQFPHAAQAKAFDLKEIVNPDVIGGIIIQVEDRKIDASVSRKIKDFKRNFEDNPYVPEL